MRRIDSSLMSATGGTIAALALAGAAAAPATAAGSAGDRATSRPDVTSPAGPLSAVSAISTTDAWSVGYSVVNHTKRSLAMHWNGTSWSSVATPDPSATSNTLAGVSAVSSDDVWAVGQDDDASGTPQTLILHWDGTQWTQVPSPSLTPDLSQLNAVSADSSTDAWAVGIDHDMTTGVDETLVLHWDGSSWTRVSSPSPGTSIVLNGVSADGPTDAWAVGQAAGGMAGNEDRSLVLHWNGTAWSQVPSPNPSTDGENLLTAVSAVSSQDVWAVGQWYRSRPSYRTLILHWNGTKWTRVFSPSPSADASELLGVSAVSATDAWAVGNFLKKLSSGGNGDHTLVLHWNGTVWRRVAAPSPGAAGGAPSGLAAVSADGSTDAWAVGSRSTITGHLVVSGIVLHWNGTSWTRK